VSNYQRISEQPIKRKVLTRITSVRFSNSRRSIFSGLLLKDPVKLKSAKIVVVIDIPTEALPVEPAVGQIWEVEGLAEEQQIAKDGFLIKESTMRNPDRCELRMPADAEGLIRFIAEDPAFVRIGTVKARQLVEHFGHDLVRLATSGDREALRGHLTDQSIDALITGFERYKNLRHAKWLSGHGIPLTIQRRLFKAHGETSIDMIRENAYVLITFGMKFRDVESIAKRYFNLGEDDPRRLAAAAERALIDHCRDYHTLASPRVLRNRIQSILETHNDDVVNQALELAKDARYVHYNTKNGVYHNVSLLIMERVVAKRLKAVASLKTRLTDREYNTIVRVASALPYGLTEKQLEAVESSLSHGLSCVTGGAGTGKTTVLRTTVQVYRLLGYDVKAMALSGRAAMRLRESIGIDTMTIAGFLRNSEVQDRPTLIVIDEASMIDLSYLYQIVIKSLSTTRLLFCGDPDQLPPIGPGIPFQDILKSGIAASVELDIVQRQDETTGIPEYSREIRMGRIPESLSAGKVVFHETAADDIASVCCELLTLAPEETKVVTPTRTSAELINKLCQEAVNPNGSKLVPRIWNELYKTEYRQGDPVLFTKNDYDNDIQNGSLGKIVSTHQIDDGTFGLVMLDDTDETLPLTRTFLDTMKLGYAMTLHKTQGSQIPRVVIALENSPLVDRSWIYTGITRSEAEVHIVGSRSVFLSAIQRESAHHIRKTFLKELIDDAPAASG